MDSALKPEIWELAYEPAGFTGTGFLRFLQTGNTYKDPLVYDAMFDPHMTLIYKVLIDNPGDYTSIATSTSTGLRSRLWTSSN